MSTAAPVPVAAFHIHRFRCAVVVKVKKAQAAVSSA